MVLEITLEGILYLLRLQRMSHLKHPFYIIMRQREFPNKKRHKHSDQPHNKALDDFSLMKRNACFHRISLIQFR